MILYKLQRSIVKQNISISQVKFFLQYNVLKVSFFLKPLRLFMER